MYYSRTLADEALYYSTIYPNSRDLGLKFVYDLSCLEIINLLSIGLASHNSRLQVASDLPLHGQII